MAVPGPSRYLRNRRPISQRTFKSGREKVPFLHILSILTRDFAFAKVIILISLNAEYLFDPIPVSSVSPPRQCRGTSSTIG
jgi:hypothetical protein